MNQPSPPPPHTPSPLPHPTLAPPHLSPHPPPSIRSSTTGSPFVRSRPSRGGLLSNGLAALPTAPALGVTARRYHGLLVAATKPPVGRIVALHSMIEQLVIPREDGTEEVIE